MLKGLPKGGPLVVSIYIHEDQLMAIRLVDVIQFCGCEMRKEYLPQFMSTKATLLNSFGETIGELEVPHTVLADGYHAEHVFNFWAWGVLQQHYPEQFVFLDLIKSLNQ